MLNSFPRNKSGNILIISFHRLGDTVFTVPAVKEIFNYYSSANVKIITFPECKCIYKILFDEQSIITIDTKEFKLGSRFASRNASHIVKQLKAEVIFDVTGTITSSFLIAGSHASVIIGLNQKYYKSLYSKFVPVRKTPDLMDRYLDVVEMVTPLINRSKLKNFPVSFSGSGRILINPFAGWKAKEWNIRKFILLAIYLKNYYPVAFICEKSQLSGELLDELREYNIPWIFTPTVDDLIEEINNCSLFIGNDSGPLYIAYLLGKPTFAIFGPTSADFPYIKDSYHRYIQKKLQCSPSGSQYCFTEAGLFCPAFECMNLLTIDEVKMTVFSFIREIGLGESN